MCALASNFAENGIFPVIEYTIDNPAMLNSMAELLHTRPVMFVALAPPLGVCRRRNAARPVEQRVDFDYAPQYHAMRERLGDTGWWLDTATMTAEETADAIVAHAHDKAVLRRDPGRPTGGT